MAHLLPGEPEEFMCFECSESGQLLLTDSEYSDLDLMDDFARHLRVMHKGQWSLPVFEALAISEVLHLQEHENIAAMILDSNIADLEEKARQLGGAILKLKPEATST